MLAVKEQAVPCELPVEGTTWQDLRVALSRDTCKELNSAENCMSWEATPPPDEPPGETPWCDPTVNSVQLSPQRLGVTHAFFLSH